MDILYEINNTCYSYFSIIISKFNIYIYSLYQMHVCVLINQRT